MSRRAKIIGASALAAVAVAGFAAWWFIFRDNSPPPVSLEQAVASLEETPTTDTLPPVPTTAPDAAPAGDATAGIDGTWVVDSTAGSFVGYRVQEELANIGATTAVGRTSTLTGSLEIEGTVVLDAQIEADLSQLRSDQSNRDRQMRSQALETDAFPLATFDLTEPIELGRVPAEGEALAIAGRGDLTIHGVTRNVEIPMEAQLEGGVIVAIGSIDVVFSDYDIDSPSSFVVLSVDDEGVMEFQLFFARA